MAGRWLLKTEPEEWSWEHQQANGGVSQWDGVRNAQAQKHLRAMANGDLCLFYHSGAKSKEIVGIARVCKTFYPDPSDPTSKHGMVDIEAVSKLALPLPLSRLKQEERLRSFILFRQPRLSVVPIDSFEWELICELAGELVPPLPLLNGDGRMRVRKEDLELSDAKTRVSPPSIDEDTKLSLPEEKAGSRVRVSKHVASLCNDETRAISIDMIEPSQPSTGHTRVQRKKHHNAHSFVDGSTAKAIGTAEGLRSRGKAWVEDQIALNPVTRNSLDERKPHKERSSKILEHSRLTELPPDARRVYSRRSRKPRQVAYEGAAPTYCENLQSAAEPEAEQESMLNTANTSDSEAMVSVADRVYKKRIRKEKLVESLLC